MKHDLAAHVESGALGSMAPGCPECQSATVEAAEVKVERALSELQGIGGSMGTVPFRCDRDLLREFLIKAACPVVCRGYLDGGENWHELCIAKGDEALAILMAP